MASVAPGYLCSEVGCGGGLMPVAREHLRMVNDQLLRQQRSDDGEEVMEWRDQEKKVCGQLPKHFEHPVDGIANVH